jgi:hypothetical protein
MLPDALCHSDCHQSMMVVWVLFNHLALLTQEDTCFSTTDNEAHQCEDPRWQTDVIRI